MYQLIQTQSLFDGIPEELGEEVFTPLLSSSGGFRLERIVSQGHTTPPGEWYDQEEHEWVFLLQGSARVQFAGDARPRQLVPGDYLHIPPHCRHRVAWTDPEGRTIWLALHHTGR